jgi:hypothetical protein
MSEWVFEKSRIRELWLLGRCPCCGGAIIDWEQPGTGEVVQSRLIAEIVMICGRCIANKHCDPDRPDGKATLEYILEAIADGAKPTT